MEERTQERGEMHETGREHSGDPDRRVRGHGGGGRGLQTSLTGSQHILQRS